MARPGGSAFWEVVRETVRRESERTSLRQVAEALEAHPSTLHYFLAGRKPRAPLAQKLTAWYAGVSAAAGDPGAEEAERYLSRLLGKLGGRRRRRALEQIRDVIREHHRDAGLPVPEWLETADGDDAEGAGGSGEPSAGPGSG